MEARTLSEPFAVPDMLWDKSDVKPVKLISGKRGVACALTTCDGLAERLTAALDLASIDVSVFRDADECAEAITCMKPDILFLDDRIAPNTIEVQAKLERARVTETLPVLPITSDSQDDTFLFSLRPHSDEIEIFLKVRALLRRERPAALRGRRQRGSITLDEPQFKLFLADKSADLSKTDLCLLGPFFDVQDARLDRQSLEQLAFDASTRKVGARIVDFQISKLRRRLKAQLGVDPLESVRGVGYALSAV